MRLDVVIFGGGCAGMWLLDELTRRGARVVLLEAAELGRGQTVAAQGILHGGLKYTLSGLLTGAAAQIREMPLVWRECLAGRRQPDLSGVRVRSECCYLWRTDSLRSRAGMIGAKLGLRVAPQDLSPAQRPPVLDGCPGTVARLEEQVISTTSFLQVLADRHRERLLKVAPDGITIETDGPGQVRAIHLTDPPSRQTVTLEPRHVIFTAGAGNAELRRQVGLTTEAMQRRPLHMVMLRGNLPPLNGHCVDGAKTRVTITSDTDAAGRTVWQIGGQIAEEGVRYDAASLIIHARAELRATIPGLDLTGTEWATYRVDRAEGLTPGGTRPETPQVLRDGNTLTAWPTKLALAPRLAEEVAALMDLEPRFPKETGVLELPAGSAAVSAASVAGETPALRPTDIADWPRPTVALPPWETCGEWRSLDGSSFSTVARKSA